MPRSADELLTLAIVAVAAGYLARRAWGVFARKRSGGCGSCAGCSSDQTAVNPHSQAFNPQVFSPQVFSIDQLLEPIVKKPR
jgi:hypothetical protein